MASTKSVCKQIKPLAPVPTLLRVNVIGFIAIYAVIAYFMVMSWMDPELVASVPKDDAPADDDTPTEFSQDDFYAILFTLAGFVHAFTFFLEYWVVSFKAFNRFSKTSMDKATSVIVYANKYQGDDAICEIIEKSGRRCFEFQGMMFIEDTEQQTFLPSEYPIALNFAEYQAMKGLESQEQVENARTVYGNNLVEFPEPDFKQLLFLELMKPFFVFQVFCILLWCLDGYIMMNVFTFFMLVTFEGVMVKLRIKHLVEMKSMIPAPYTVQVYRERSWQPISTTDIVVGDVISIPRSTTDDMIVPCDLLLLAGSCVVNEAMLTGESIPQMKEGCSERDPQDNLDMRNVDKLHVLYGGTRVVQTSPEKAAGIPKPKDGGVIGLALRTGIGTSKGELMRTILYSTDTSTANNSETTGFLLSLLVFAIAASAYVLKKGLEDPTQSRFKLLLHCTTTITAVIPPELPMELSMAVNTSLAALHKFGIFCTQPFRIPFAGKLDILCFDKTGTLTSDDLILKGATGLVPADSQASSDISNEVIPPSDFPDELNSLIGGCHSLIFIENKLTGDPLEMAAMQGINWTFSRDTSASQSKKGQTVNILHRFAFSSRLKRMSNICRVNMGSSSTNMVFVKGAPEVIQDRMVNVPDRYTETYQHFANQGFRVLATAYKVLSQSKPDQLRKITREEAEQDLHFAGFLLFDCPIKKDSLITVRQLQQASQEVVMITGDNALTGCKVSQDLGIVKKPVLILSGPHEDITPQNMEWVSVDGLTTIPFDPQSPDAKLFQEHDMCVTGNTLNVLASTKVFSYWIPKVKVFARVSPEDKELVLQTLKSEGYYASMCGDGTNDVGALKQAHVGVALLSTVSGLSSSSDSQSKHGKPKPASSGSSGSSASSSKKKVTKNQLRNRKAAVSSASSVASSSGASSSSAKKSISPQDIKTTADAAQAFIDAFEDEDEVPMVKLGDASIAAPFTSKKFQAISVVKIIQQGRCTLVTTFQMYKILALNCLVNAYGMSVLHLDGVKLGDLQMTFQAVILSACFFFMSQSKPIPKLSKHRPDASIFCLYFFLSVVGQFAIFLGSLIYLVNYAQGYMPADWVIDLEADFKPNIVSTVVYLILTIMQVSTFVNNYRGEPFMESFSSNKKLSMGLGFAGAVCLLLASEFISPLNDALELVPYPHTEFRNTVVGVLVGCCAAAYIWEMICRKLFSGQSKVRL